MMMIHENTVIIIITIIVYYYCYTHDHVRVSAEYNDFVTHALPNIFIGLYLLQDNRMHNKDFVFFFRSYYNIYHFCRYTKIL